MPQSPVGQIGFVLRVCPFACRPELGLFGAFARPAGLGLFHMRPHVFAFRFQIINRKSPITNPRGVPLSRGRVAGMCPEKWVSLLPERTVSPYPDVNKENLGAGPFQVLDCCTNGNIPGVLSGTEKPPSSGRRKYACRLVLRDRQELSLR